MSVLKDCIQEQIWDLILVLRDINTGYIVCSGDSGICCLETFETRLLIAQWNSEDCRKFPVLIFTENVHLYSST